MADTATATKPAVRYSDEQILKMLDTNPPSKWATIFNEEELGRATSLLRRSGAIKGTKYEPAAMDGYIHELKSKALKDPSAKALLDAIRTVVNLIPKNVEAGTVFDLRMDQNGKGYCKMTGQYRKIGDETVKVKEFNEWKGLPTVKLSGSF